MKALAFRIGKIPVRIHPSFLIMTVILGFGGVNDLRVLVSWFFVVLVSVLIHEFGHALMGKVFGLSPEIDLHGMGGTTSWPAGRSVGNGKSILISLAGPLVGIVVGLAVWLLVPAPPNGTFARLVYGDVLFVNIGWGIFNLVPMLPLDGGNVLRSGLNAATKGNGETPARIIGIVFAAVMALAGIGLLFVGGGTWWIALLGVMFATQNYRALKDHGARNADAPLKTQLDHAYEALKQNDAPRVLALSVPVIDSARSLPVRAEAIHLAAYGLLLARRAAEADEMIARLPPGYPPHPAYAELRAQVLGQA